MLVYRKAPPTIKSKALLTLTGGCLFICPIFLYVLRLTVIIPGNIGFCMALGSFLVVLSFKIDPQLVNALIEYSQAVKIETLNEILTLCSHCKSIEDFDDKWMPIDEFFFKNSIMTFSNGICPICFKKYYPDIHQD